MDTFSLYVPNFLPGKEYFVPEKNLACPGCGLALAVRHTYKALEEEIKKASWQTSKEGEFFACPPGSSEPGNSEVSLLRIKKGKADIMFCFDNEAGVHLPETIKKSMPISAVAEGIFYVATACPSYPFDLREKVKKAMEVEGKTYIHILCPCPVNWQFDPELTVKIGRFAVESRTFPLYEVQGGSYRLTVPIPKPRALADYLKAQKRFEDLSERQIEEATSQVESDYQKLTDTIR
jgi:pyruvate/2-oxoacid:ferredoxin oxidoreductase beta subunit